MISDTSPLSICGYQKKHPLEDIIIFTISLNRNNNVFQLNKPQQVVTIVEELNNACNSLIQIFSIIKVSNIKKILEIGTFTGLSGLTMSLSLPSDRGELVTLDKNAERIKIASNFFKKAEQESKIKAIIGPALESISNFKKKEQKFDLVFIDADKENYKNYYNQSLDLIEKNGLIIVDNVLWHGEVANTKNQDKVAQYKSGKEKLFG